MISWTTPLVQIPRPALATDVRRAMVANALSTTANPGVGPGLEAGNPMTRTNFEALLGPGRWDLDRPFRMWKDSAGKWRTEGVSTCAMIALGLLRRLCVDCDDVLDGYADDIGTGLDVAIRYARTLADSHGAWQTPRDGLRPSPGDIVQVTGGMHVLTVVAWDGDTLWSADGGQTGHRGLQACKLCKRTWHDTAAGPRLDARPVVGWITVDLLGYLDEPVTVPEGWEGVEI